MLCSKTSTIDIQDATFMQNLCEFGNYEAIELMSNEFRSTARSNLESIMLEMLETGFRDTNTLNLCILYLTVLNHSSDWHITEESFDLLIRYLEGCIFSDSLTISSIAISQLSELCKLLLSLHKKLVVQPCILVRVRKGLN